MKSIFFACLLLVSNLASAQLLKVGVAGLSHDHANSIMQQYKKGEVILLGIAEADQNLIARYKKNFQVPDSLFYKDVASMLHKTKPDAVLAYNAISEHIDVVEACAPKGISVMVEKPLATTNADAERMKMLADKHKIHLLTILYNCWLLAYQVVS